MLIATRRSTLILTDVILLNGYIGLYCPFLQLLGRVHVNLGIFCGLTVRICLSLSWLNCFSVIWRFYELTASLITISVQWSSDSHFADSWLQSRLGPKSEPTRCWKLLSCMFYIFHLAINYCCMYIFWYYLFFIL